MIAILRSLYLFRNFISSSIKNEFKNRFSQSKLGFLWLIISPLAQVLIYALILSKVLGAKLPGIDNNFAYALYLMAGIVIWTLLSEVLTRSISLFVQNGNLLKKVSFPRITLPIIVIGSCLVTFVMMFASMLIVFGVLGKLPSLVYFWILPLTIVGLLFAGSLGLILGVFNVFIRDIEQITPIVLQVFFWFTPIVYPITIVSESLQEIIKLNPLFPLVTAFQSVLIYDQTPDFISMVPLTLGSLVMSIAALLLFRRASAEMVDVL